MISKFSLLAGFAGILSLPGVTFVQAQTTPTVPNAITPEQHRIDTKGGVIHSGRGRASGNAIALSASFGWNYFHATNCDAYFDGTTNWVYVYPQEGGYWFTSNTNFENVFVNQCVLGYWVAIYVTDSATGYYDQIFTYDYK